MRIRAAVVTFCAALGLAVGALVLYYYDGGSKDHTYLRVGDCWDYSTRFDESVHLKPCSDPHYGEVMFKADFSAIDRHPAGGIDAWGFCKQQLSEVLSRNSHLGYWMVPNDGVLCAVISADNASTRMGGLTGRVDR
ncbi:hypothetical protein NDR87_04475 [Nocardia sp. CDC159]|uniref:Uncharacterized protein n=1 Tax=Nocardia pulmonis TaxID=2951408 RepID=A0A9X2E2J2_9NOCA|nr:MULTISPECIES: hypothetical protein [Nocardia]MCM6773082.1 hypothetical protein [Nocardia pulmonis]MCM6785615.1 hypothetical protein [Nocardia sp. CDC159]